MQGEDHAIMQVLKRPINCLTDQDRNIRREGLVAIMNEMKKSKVETNVRIITTTNLTKNLLFTLGDPIEANRQTTINILRIILKGAGLKKDDIQPYLGGLIARVNATPFPQKSQDLRKDIVILLRELISQRDDITGVISELMSGLAKCLADPSSDIKNNSCLLLDLLASTHKNTVGKYSLAVIKGLSDNLKHNKAPVRRKTLETLSKMLITEGAGGHFEHVQTGLRSSLADSKKQVRLAAIQCAANLLKYLSPKYLKQHEPALVSLILGGLNDQQEQNIAVSKRLLDECGKSINELYGQQ